MVESFYKIIGQSGKNSILTTANLSGKAYLASKVFQNNESSMVAVLTNQKQALNFTEELKFFMPDFKDDILYFTGYNILPFKSLSYHGQTASTRIAVLSKLLNLTKNKVFIVTYIDNLLQKLIPKTTIYESEQLVINNEEVDRDELILKIEAGGYTRTSLVEEPGDYSIRGGILDIYSPQNRYPVRMEFFGDLVESLRYFSPVSQRGIKEIAETIIIPATEAVIEKEFLPHILARLRLSGKNAGLDSHRIQDYVQQLREFGRFPGVESMLSIVYEELDSFFDYMPKDALYLLDNLSNIESAADDFQQKIFINYENTKSDNRLCVDPFSIYLDWPELVSLLDDKNVLDMKNFSVLEPDKENLELEFNCEDNSDLSSQLKREGQSENLLKPLADWLFEKKANGMKAISIVSQNSQAKRLASLLSPYGIEPEYCKDFNEVKQKKPGIYLVYGSLTSGFVVADDNIALITENEIFQINRLKRRAKIKRGLKTEFITPEELKNGDIIVHIEHGIGKFEGLTTLEVDRIAQDFLLLEYQDNDKLYLPVDRIEMIGKYVGIDGFTPILDKIGSKAWVKSKAKAKEEVEKLAADLLDLYAQRRVNKGFAFSACDNYFSDFEASFPFNETSDQLKAIDEVLADMESQIPMDRLVCGDVGYGKTEVAMRAAFKAANDGQQVAIVVPTTILAEQHLTTFKERFANYPVNIECLSRFRNRKEQKSILYDLEAGKIDIVIGTHRLLQKDISFNSLGLLVIDEEQRFGVKHKEKLKKKRKTIDVLALTATPIPRTLHLSLTGMRDISVIATPPEDRQPIVSYISKYDDSIVADSIRKEVARKGQVFFVHNNIKTIVKVKDNLQKLIPEISIGIAHGRLLENELEKVMLDFINLKIDVLVCTTIIESGLDIPSANTMIINKAERFGLSQIYQLRGRVGRGDHQAYAYLFISDESRLTKDAKKRLSALMEHKDLGSGFQIAMKDLQIRGAGTALGASQSGHIAAVGYDMFLKLLDQAVKDMKGETIVEPLEPEINVSLSTYFPKDYIESVEQRLTIYRRLSRITNIADISNMQKELVDRFGKLPKEAENMLLKIMLRVYCVKVGVKRLDLTFNTLTLFFSKSHQSNNLNIEKILKAQKIKFEFIKKDSVKINLGLKRNNLSKALLQTRNILKSFQG